MKIDLHVHSKEISSCGKLSVEEIVDIYAGTDYDAIVLTNHFNTETANRLETGETGDFDEIYFETYEKAFLYGKEKGLLVLNGYEIRFDGSSNDYLVYGMDRKTAKEYRRFFQMTEAEFGTFARENGFLFYQAHPFRKGMKIVDPACLYGMEVKNTHPRHDSRNDIAMLWAEKFSLRKIGGSDCHQIQDAAGSGIITERNVKNMDDLTAVLKDGDYIII
ncbi:MAG: PHP domain-containing protein [Lentisphaeria bacterium]|nr:PHP domain-containing protein [Lentisphaeria bacterium]